MQPSEQAVVLALVETVDRSDLSRRQLADMLDALGGVEAFLAPTTSGLEPVDQDRLEELRAALEPSTVERWQADLDRLRFEHPDVRVATICDDDYPLNLRQTYDRTPFLFVRGHLHPADERAVAVVGTRKPSPEGLSQARRLAAGMAEAGVTVVSGLAAGIDAAAHAAALEHGGRTVAVLGHGIAIPPYPAANRPLAAQIVEAGGALVSQFWPEQPPTRATFPMRNVTTSGLSLGTVVVEAGETSGARQQARRCLEHGKQLFLLRQLATHQDWARAYAERPGVVVVDDASEILSRLEALLPGEEPVQLAFG